MKEKEILLDFGKALVETPLTIILLFLDIIGLAAVIYWVVDDFQETTVVLIFIITVISGQYIMFRRIWLQLDNFKQAKPLIEFTKARQAQMYHASPIVEGRRPTYEILQVWFINNPNLSLETSIAKGVTAKVKIFKSDSSELFEFHGQWAKSNAPDNVGYDDILDAVDIQPSHIESKLFIALKYPPDSSCYAFTREGLRSTPDGRSPKYDIAEGEYKIRVHLRGIGVDEIFWFDFHNFGANKSLKLERQSI
ncbi:hypothetical protein ACFLV7_04165 [Chloroflexota bacterium]